MGTWINWDKLKWRKCYVTGITLVLTCVKEEKELKNVQFLDQEWGGGVFRPPTFILITRFIIKFIPRSKYFIKLSA
jgi:hypothetical protein